MSYKPSYKPRYKLDFNIKLNRIENNKIYTENCATCNNENVYIVFSEIFSHTNFRICTILPNNIIYTCSTNKISTHINYLLLHRTTDKIHNYIKLNNILEWEIDYLDFIVKHIIMHKKQNKYLWHIYNSSVEYLKQCIIEKKQTDIDGYNENVIKELQNLLNKVNNP